MTTVLSSSLATEDFCELHFNFLPQHLCADNHAIVALLQYGCYSCVLSRRVVRLTALLQAADDVIL